MSVPQPEFPIFTLTNGQRLGWYWDFESPSIILVAEDPQNPGKWNWVSVFQMGAPYVYAASYTNNPDLKGKGTVAMYLFYIIETANRAIRQRWPALFAETPPSTGLPPGMANADAETRTIAMAIQRLRLVDNQFTA